MTSKHRWLIPTLVFLIALGLAVLIFIFSRTQTISPTNPIGLLDGDNQVAASLAAKATDADTDNDGLKDWEETLWGTDSKRADTDADGTSDGDEAKQGRNPVRKSTKPGDDAIDVQEILDENMKASIEQSKNLNPTERFARDFFSKYLILKQGGQPIDVDTQEALVENILKTQDDELGGTAYTITDITISPNDTIEGIRAYGNGLGRVLKTFSPRVTKNEIEILRVYLETEDTRALAELDAHVKGYRDVLQQSLKVATPRSAVTLQLQYINALSNLLRTAELLRNTANDPLSALTAAAQYEAHINDLLGAAEQLTLYFVQKNVIFQQTDDGYALTHGI